MSVFDGPAVWLLELMVHLVNIFVEPFSVQSSVAPVEAGVLNQEKEGKLNQHLLPVGGGGGGDSQNLCIVQQMKI